MTEIQVNLSNMSLLSDQIRYRNRIEIRKKGDPKKTIRKVSLVGFVPSKKTCGPSDKSAERYPRLVFRVESFWIDSYTGSLKEESKTVGNGGRIYAEFKKI